MNQTNKEILQIAIPSIISNITVPLLGLVDVTITGHLGDVAYIGAIAVGGMLFNMIYWIFGFLRMGTGGMTSQAYGSRNDNECRNILLRSLGISILLASILIMLQIGIFPYMYLGSSGCIGTIQFHRMVSWNAELQVPNVHSHNTEHHKHCSKSFLCKGNGNEN